MLCEFLFGNSKRILLVPGIRNEIFSSWKNLTDRTHMGGNMLDAVQDHAFVITEDDIAVLAHQLHDQTLPAWITQFVKMLQLKFHNALHARLLHIQDTGTADMLTEQHAEIRGCKRTDTVLICKIDQRKGCTCA